MSMEGKTLEGEIDRLYQLPLAEFTPARNDLGKQFKDHRTAIGALQKPNLPAWAVNQLYWHRRALYDAMVDAAERARTAQVAAMSGHRGDIDATLKAHGAAMKAAAQEIRRLLAEAGESVSPATMTAVTETFQALPSTATPGRLTRPLRPMGLEALARLLVPGGSTAAATILPFASKTRTAERRREADGHTDADAAGRERSEAKQRAEAARREAEAQARAVKELEAELREARAAERAAEQAAGRARTAASAAEAEHQRLIRRVEDLADEAARLMKEASSKDRAVTDASVARQRVEARLRAITPGR